MKIFHTMNPFQHSFFKDNRLLNFADDGGGSASQSGNSDEPDPNTPAGRKWKELREKAKAAEEEARAEREARIRAEERASAFEEFKSSFSTATKKKEDDPKEEDTPVNPEDEKYVAKILSKQMRAMGLDKIPEVVQALQKNTEQIHATTVFEQAKAKLSSEFKDSVPFDYEAALKYAREQGLGLVASTAEQALRMAHKEMNEQAFIKFWSGNSDKKKKAPSMAYSGGKVNDDLIVIPDEDDNPHANDPKIESFEDSVKMAKSMMEEGI